MPRLVGIGKAKELVFTAKILDGVEAADIGLVEQAVTQNENGDAAYLKARELAKEICSKVRTVIFLIVLSCGVFLRALLLFELLSKLLHTACR